jgi:hypothetical protein
MLNSLKFVIKMHRIDCKRALNYDAPINILLLAFSYIIFAGVESVRIAGFALNKFGYINYFAYLGYKLKHDILEND